MREMPLSTDVSLVPATWGLGAQLCLAVLQPSGLGFAVSFLQGIFPIQDQSSTPALAGGFFTIEQWGKHISAWSVGQRTKWP